MTLFSTAQFWWQKHSAREDLNALADEHLLAQFAEKAKPHYLEALMQRHNDALYHFLLGLSDATLAEDIAQQTWLKLIEQPQRYRKTNASFRTWLFTVGRNRLLDSLRQNNRWQWQPLEETAETELPAESEALTFSEHEALLSQFNNALEKLPFAQREALMLQLDGFSIAEVADITAEKPETIKSRLRFARHHLKQTLEQTE